LSTQRVRNPLHIEEKSSPAAKPQSEGVHGDLSPLNRHILDLQNKVGNCTVSRLIDPALTPCASEQQELSSSSTIQQQSEQVQCSMEPWKDEPSNQWSIRSLAGAELAPGFGRLHIEFELKNRLTNRLYRAVYNGQVAGLGLGYSISLSPSWTDFGSAQKVRPSELAGLGADVRCLGFSVGAIGVSTASLKLPNVDTAPARIDIGGVSAAFGFKASAFYSGGEFRVYKKEGTAVA
jgi:hypothetical protein